MQNCYVYCNLNKIKLSSRNDLGSYETCPWSKSQVTVMRLNDIGI